MAEQEQVENRASRLLMERIEGKELAERDARWLKEKAPRDFRWAEGGGSWNHAQILAAAELWRDAQPGIISWWKTYLRLQLGEADPGEAAIDYFGGTEQFSNTYEGWRWGAALAVRLLALRLPEHPAAPEILRLTARYSEVQTALLALGAAPRPTKLGTVVSTPARAGAVVEEDVQPHANRRGQLWWNGPSLPMAGARSTPAHLGTDERMPLYAWYAAGGRIDYGRFGWPTAVWHKLVAEEKDQPIGLLRAPTGQDFARLLLKDIRLLVPHHFLRWDTEDVRVNYMEKLVNGNTTSILGHVHYDKEDRAVYLFPWPGRLREGLGEAVAWYEPNSPWTLNAKSRFGQVRHELPRRLPDSHLVIGPEGLRRIA